MKNCYQQNSLIKDLSELKLENYKNDSNKIKNIDIFDDDENLIIDNNIYYDQIYGAYYDQNIIMNQLGLANSLFKHQITPLMRSKMINWMYEIFSLFDVSNTETFIISVQIMDLYLKNTQQKFLNQDLHLIGVVCIIIASKTNDIYHITFQAIFDDIIHKKFSINQMKAKEADILNTIQFDLYFPNLCKIVKRILSKNFYLDNSEAIKTLYEQSILITKMCVYDEKMHEYTTTQLGVSIIIYSIKDMFLTQQIQNLSLSYYEKQEQLIDLIKDNLNFNEDSKIIDQCLIDLAKLIQNFDISYKGLITQYDLKD